MTNTTPVSPISLTFNDSWLAHIGSRIYQLAVETIELLSSAFSHPLIQPYSGKRLYQLVNTFRHSMTNTESYNEARSHYAENIVKALKNEKNIFEKAKSVRTILNTHIIGLSILQDKDKNSLSDHVGYTIMPDLINGFGEQMANRALLALHDLNDGSEKSLDECAKLYKDLILQQKELDNFVKALQKLNSHVSKNILIHELILARNKYLTREAKNKVISTLKNGHYIQVKLQRRVQIMERLHSETQGKKGNTATIIDEKEIMQELKMHRDLQIEALQHRNASMFFPSNSLTESKLVQPTTNGNPSSVKEFATQTEELPQNESIDQTEEPFESESSNQTVDSSQSESSKQTKESSENESTNTIESSDSTLGENDSLSEFKDAFEELREVELPDMPIGITNKNQNCWYNAALQIIANTGLRFEIANKMDLFSKKLPTLAKSFKAYQTAYREQSDIRYLEHPSRYTDNESVIQLCEEYIENEAEFCKKVRKYREDRTFSALDVKDEMQAIRAEIHNKVDKEFKNSGADQEDSQQFLFRLLENLSIDVAQIGMGGESLLDLTSQYVLISKDNSQTICLENLFAATDYTLGGIILHACSNSDRNSLIKKNGGHYYAVVFRNDAWYRCDDTLVEKISLQRLKDELNRNSALIIATRVQDDDDKASVSEGSTFQGTIEWVKSFFGELRNNH